MPSIVADRAPVAIAPPAPEPVALEERTHNPLRPSRLADMIGQARTRRMLRRVIDTALTRLEPLDHTLLVGASGLGKSTLAYVIANELGVNLYQVEAPISHDSLLDLREVMRDRDMLFLDEIHQQAIAERRGRSTATQPEVLFNVMEDRTIVSGLGVLPFPRITVMGGTTDEGALPDAFVNRFPLRPVLDPYTEDELAQVARLNAEVLGMHISDAAATLFASAARGVPRQINNYVRNAVSLSAVSIDEALAREVLDELNRVTEDGLTVDMQRTLIFLFTKCRRTVKRKVTYQASIGHIASGIGKSRDSRAIALRVEPYLIEQGYLGVGHGGRILTPAGVKRAKELLNG